MSLTHSSYRHLPPIDACVRVAQYVQTPWWIAYSAPPIPERLRFWCKLRVGWAQPQILFAGLHTLLRDMMGQIVNLIQEEFALSGFYLRLCSWKQSNTTCNCFKCSSSSLKRLLHHPNRLSSISGSVPLGISALTFEKWEGHCTGTMVDGVVKVQLPFSFLEGNIFPNVCGWVTFHPPVVVVFRSRGSLALAHLSNFWAARSRSE